MIDVHYLTLDPMKLTAGTMWPLNMRERSSLESARRGLAGGKAALHGKLSLDLSRNIGEKMFV